MHTKGYQKLSLQNAIYDIVVESEYLSSLQKFILMTHTGLSSIVLRLIDALEHIQRWNVLMLIQN